MKIVQVFSYDRESDAFAMRTFPDSALLKGGKPVFLPYDGHEYLLSVGVALVVGKLGKGFAPRFADRYVERVAPVALFEDSTMAKALAGKNTDISMARCFDGAVNIGCMLPPHTLTETITFRLEPLRGNGSGAKEYGFSAQTVMPRWREAVSFMAQTMTFKTGDMVIIAREAPIIVTSENRLRVYTAPASDCGIDNPRNNDTILDFNIK